MKHAEFDAVVIGGGASGLSAAAEMSRGGASVAVVEREETPGGILNQCIHNGFGLHQYKEELTGPEYAERCIRDLDGLSVKVYTGMTVTLMEKEEEAHLLYGFSRESGMVRFRCRAIVLAMGCRERNRGNLGTPGTRPSGIFTAGLAQRLVNIDGMVPGRECVIVGSGDIGLIMARRMTWIGARVRGVIEIQPYPAGITRNIVQCLRDFDIPLYLSHSVTRIYGKDRISGVDVAPVRNSGGEASEAFHIPCDTLLLSVGLVPENEISRKAGVRLHPETGGPVVDARYMTSVTGIFACGNVLHVHDLVDYASEEARHCGQAVLDFLSGVSAGEQLRVGAGRNVKYVVPGRFALTGKNRFYLRSMITGTGARLFVRLGGIEVLSRKLPYVQPSEMISFDLAADVDAISSRFTSGGDETDLEVSLEIPEKEGA
ncbi:NAD(P)/FAD-dependent oxidoreductase [Marispirochaeta aestuarii]|uniref:NAD(P)/FAD-dependent oxidoreductase n=1 Tax=Marispirochaeta aestuarii TaxID=1963862 RepID=UPI002ABDE6AA|nr:NAD(P)/FAD-dependent oxidoreductase [Marispirochaeta aestuarii]